MAVTFFVYFVWLLQEVAEKFVLAVELFNWPFMGLMQQLILCEAIGRKIFFVWLLRPLSVEFNMCHFYAIHAIKLY